MKLSWWTLWVTHTNNLSNWKFSHLSQTLSSFPYRSIPDGKFPYQWSLFNFQCIRKASLFILDHIPGNVISCKILITNNRDNFLMENITLGCIDCCSEIYLWSQVFLPCKPEIFLFPEKSEIYHSAKKGLIKQAWTRDKDKAWTMY